MRKLIFTAVFTIAGSIFFVSGVHAAILEKTIDRTYRLQEEYVEVTEKVTARVVNPQYLIPSGSEEIFTIFNPILEDEDAQAKIDNAIPTIKVVDGSGKKLSFTTEVDGQNVTIKVARPANIVYNQPYAITATYNSYALSSRNGALMDLYIPSFSKEFEFSDGSTSRKYNTTVIIPKSFGDNNFVVPESKLISSGDNWQIKFTQEQLTDTISWIQMGTSQYYEFNIRQPYPATSIIPFIYNSYDVTLPRDILGGPFSQEVKFTNVSPTPAKVVEDEDGNLIATFRVPANESGEIQISGLAIVKQDQQVNIEDAGLLSDIDQEIVEKYTRPASFWEADSPEILQAANEIKGSNDDVFQILTDTYNYVVDKIDYSNVKRFGLNERQGALATFQGGAAVCMEYSDLFIALARAQGIPARAAFGYGYDARSTNGEQTPHQWAEVYIPSIDQWIGVDTTWGESGPAIIGGDLNHFYKYVASSDPQTPAPVSISYFGITPSVSSEDFTISALRELPEDVSYQSQNDLLATYPEQQSQLEGSVLLVYSVPVILIGSAAIYLYVRRRKNLVEIDKL